jgi:hypothetical protein
MKNDKNPSFNVARPSCQNLPRLLPWSVVTTHQIWSWINTWLHSERPVTHRLNESKPNLLFFDSLK